MKRKENQLKAFSIGESGPILRYMKSTYLRLNFHTKYRKFGIDFSPRWDFLPTGVEGALVVFMTLNE